MVLIILSYGVFGGRGSKVTVDGVKSGFVTIGDKTTPFKDGTFTISERLDGEYPVTVTTETGKRIHCDPIRFVGGSVVPTTPASIFEAYRRAKALQDNYESLKKEFEQIKEKYGEISLF